MNHQPFRSWLLSEEELTIEQTQALQEHMRDCETCRQIDSSWQELQAVIERTSQLAPTPGFVDRWQIRLVENRQHEQKLRGWYIISATGIGVISLLVLVATQVWSLIEAPNVYIAALFDQLMGILSIYFTIRNLAGSFPMPEPVYTLIAMFLLFGMISFMSVLWLAAYRKFSMARREA
jgi:hypothetical protein